MKLRGIMSRRADTPEYVRRMQTNLLDIASRAKDFEELRQIEPAVRETYLRYLDGLEDTDIQDLVIHRMVGRTR